MLVCVLITYSDAYEKKNEKIKAIVQHDVKANRRGYDKVLIRTGFYCSFYYIVFIYLSRAQAKKNKL